MRELDVRRCLLIAFVALTAITLIGVVFVIDLSELAISSKIPNQIFNNKLKTKSQRKFQNHRQELVALNQLLIRPKLCRTDVITIFVYSVSETSGKYYERRQTARKTWIKDAISHNICVYFVVAFSDDSRIQSDIEWEAFRYKDIIEFAFIEDYYNLTLKTISVLYYIKENVESELVMKADDDLVVNIKLLIELKGSFKSGISGRMITGLRPDRNELGRQYIPECVYPNKTLPKFTTGLAYILSRDSVTRLISTLEAYSGPIVDIEDVFITGVIAELAQIARHDRKEFCSSYKCPKRMCFMFDCIVFNGCETSLELYNFWTHWRQLSSNYCFDYWEEIIALCFFLLAIILVLNFFYFK